MSYNPVCSITMEQGRAVLPSDRHWVGTWAAPPAPAEGVVGFNNHTLRMMPRLSLGGDTLRVRISNAYGARPLAIGAARIGIRDKGPGIVPGSNKTLTFGGRSEERRVGKERSAE